MIFVGSAGNVATGVTLSGDATISNAGMMTLANTPITPGTYTKLQIDSKGRAIASAALNSSDVTAALGYTPGTGNGLVMSVSADTTAGNPITITGTTANPTVNLVKSTAAANG